MRLITTTDHTFQSPWVGLESEIDRIFNTALTDFSGRSREPNIPVDVYEDRTNTYVRAELPGVARETIGVEMVEGYLTIQATRKREGDGAAASLTRSISVPEEVQTDKVRAAYENGVLTVTLPKKEAAKPRKVTVAVN